ncbi:uncharacterized protein LOC111370605 [Olea europaea var. sylvestris]|uniref:uncharacterized protein LOC111370605 n=1 Tax=Olea europaea var. sylvestris TaxID=158386 RepID=UPI000C1CD915|nr:uncharacterized protein LOC111370605 [Olea europaea var. sylvestris]
MFRGIYVCFNCSKIGFRDGCRKVVGVDGCHLRGSFGGVMLTAVGIDANDCIYPIAYAVVEKENTASWRWFLTYLSEDISIGDGRGWTLMTDRQKGLQNVTDELFPAAEHRFCVRHMYTNFFNAGFKSKILKNYLWRAAKSTTVADYQHWMQQIRQLSEEAHKWLTERHPQEWSRSHFSDQSKSDILLNNLCEVFNKTLRSDREKMILSMLTSLQQTFMNRIQKRREKMMRCTGRLCPKIKKKLLKNAEKSRECTLHFSGGPEWQVECSFGTYVVDLHERTCACREWELTGIPCMHAVAVIRDCRNDPEDYVHNCYTIESYMRCYNSIMHPINGMHLWPQLDMLDITPPSWVIPRKGKRQINRRKGADEDVIVHSQEKNYLRRKGRLKMTCSVCGEQGHNKRYHSRPDAPDSVSMILLFVR